MYIQPPTNDRLIRCSVVEVNLDDPDVKYDALSYTWFIDSDIGQPTKGRMQTIVCNNGVLEVHQNLYNALLQLREVGKARLIWIDAICINQEDKEEKSKQAREEQSRPPRRRRPSVRMHQHNVRDPPYGPSLAVYQHSFLSLAL